jgi:hypothetical protein
VSSNCEPYRSRQGLPRPSVEAPARPHCTIELTNTPLSLPPMVIVTRSVSALSAASCGATPGYCSAA